jgi:hypothetical protein
MAKATAIFICTDCGKEFTRTTTHYNRQEADHWEIWAKQNPQGLCPECWKADRQAKRDADLAAQKAKTPEIEAASPITLPALVGSEKQVSWARDIRAQFLEKIQKRKIKWEAVLASEKPEIKTELAKIMNTSAKWWIENRDDSLFGIYL